VKRSLKNSDKETPSISTINIYPLYWKICKLMNKPNHDLAVGMEWNELLKFTYTGTLTLVTAY
jgi:hypothetical protein